MRRKRSASAAHRRGRQFYDAAAGVQRYTVIRRLARILTRRKGPDHPTANRASRQHIASSGRAYPRSRPLRDSQVPVPVFPGCSAGRPHGGNARKRPIPAADDRSATAAAWYARMAWQRRMQRRFLREQTAMRAMRAAQLRQASHAGKRLRPDAATRRVRRQAGGTGLRNRVMTWLVAPFGRRRHQSIRRPRHG